MQFDLTQGNLLKVMTRFSIPYLIACFLQTFYGMADLFFAGQFNAADIVTAVSVGSQVMHMVTVIIVGLAMGTTVCISYSIGAKNHNLVSKYIGNSITTFVIFAILATAICIIIIPNLVSLLNTPEEAVTETKKYLLICFSGIPFITAYNVVSAIFRGLGDTRHPMIFVFIAGIINIGLDYVFMGPLHMGASGAAFATVIAQAISVIISIIAITKLYSNIKLTKTDLKIEKEIISRLLKIGTPIACQDGLIQISFLIITMIANSRGLAIAAAVGIVEKIISFLFLVPSAMLSTVSAISAQNAGASNHKRSMQALRYGITICVIFGLIVCAICQFLSPQIVALFVTDEPDVVIYGAQYLRSYSIDCAVAGIHFCFSGFFSAYNKSLYSFAHNIISIITMRIPGTYVASILFPATLFPMGLAAPLGSALSSIICFFMFMHLKKQIPADGRLQQ